MALRLLLGLTTLLVIAVSYSTVAWKLAARFGPKVLLLTCPLAAFLFLALMPLGVAAQSDLPTSMVIINAFAVLLAFGLASRSVWRRVKRLERFSVRALAGAGGAFLLGMLLGLLPALVLDVISFTRAS